MSKHKLSASSLSTFLKSPKAYYYRYIARLDPIQQSVSTFDHDKLAGSLWSTFVDAFYKGVAEQENTSTTLNKWHEQTDGWVPDKQKDPLTKALESWAAEYYQKFRPDDGCRNGSEKFVENKRFLGYLDGLSHDGKTVHECKTAKKAQQLSEQLWKVQNSLQVKLYAVLTQATGVCIEFSWKTAPYGIFRAPIANVSAEQLQRWEAELNALADSIYLLGDNPDNYPCHPDGCCITSPFMTSVCSYQALCDMGLSDATKIGYRPKQHRQA